MNKSQIAIQLRNTSLSTHEREQLLQLLHYMTTEGIDNVSRKDTVLTGSRPYSTRTNNSKKRPKSP